jgi:hypothetical protein
VKNVQKLSNHSDNAAVAFFEQEAANKIFATTDTVRPQKPKLFKIL